MPTTMSQVTKGQLLDKTLMLNENNQTSISSWKAILSYTIVALFLFFEMGVQVSPSVMTEQLMQDLNIDAFGLGLMSGFYFYTYTCMQIPSGFLFDRFRPRNVITLAIIICALGCAFFGFSSNIYLGSMARLLMGFGSAFAFVAVLVVTADLFASKHFAFITGITQMLAAFGAMAGQMPLSYTVSHLGWRNTLFMLTVIGCILALFVWTLLNYKKDVLTCIHKNEKNKTNYRFRDILANKQTWIIALYACLLWAPMSGFASLWGVPFLEHVYNMSRDSAAFICSMMWLGLALASPLLGWISTAWRSRVWPLIISSLIGAIAFGILLIFHINSVAWLATVIFIAGAACAGQALSFTVIKEINAAQYRASAIGFNNMAVVISGAIFQPALGKLLNFHCDAMGFAGCQTQHYLTSMLLILGAYIVSLGLALFFIKESFSLDEEISFAKDAQTAKI